MPTGFEVPSEVGGSKVVFPPVARSPCPRPVPRDVLVRDEKQPGIFVRASLRWYLVLGIVLKVSLTWKVYAPVNSADPALLSGASPPPAMHPVSPMSRLSWTLAGLPSVARSAVRPTGER